MRNFIYNKSDIIVALLIIAIALVIIFFRINAIIDITGSDSSTTSESTAGSNPLDEETTDGDTGDTASPAAVTTAEAEFVVEEGATSDTVADSLVTAGLVPTADDFKNELSNQGAMEKIKAGTFIIPAGSTVADIVTILTT